MQTRYDDEDKRTFVSLLTIPTPEIIYTADKPPRLGGQERAVTPAEFARQRGMQGWTESLMAELADINEVKTIKNDYKIKYTRIGFDFRAAAINKNLNKLCIAYINSIVGFGVFAREDIPAKSAVAIYSGVIKPVKNAKEFEGGDYEFEVRNNGEVTASIDSENYGGIARFIQHIPNKNDYCFASNINPDEVADMNLNVSACTFWHLPFLIFETTRLVKAGEQLGFNYSIDEYWAKLHIAPSLFDIYGRILNPCHYTANQICITVDLKRGYAITANASLDDINKELSSTGEIVFQCEEVVVTISKDAFNKAISKSPHSPFVYLTEPTSIMPVATTPRAANVGVTEDRQSQATSFTLFNERQKADQICMNLKRITQDYIGNVSWTYHNKLKMAILNMSDNPALAKIADYLTTNHLDVVVNLDDNGNNPLLWVIMPEIDRLKNLPPMQAENKRITHTAQNS